MHGHPGLRPTFSVPPHQQTPPTPAAYRMVYWWLVIASALCTLTMMTVAMAEANMHQRSAATFNPLQEHDSGHMTLRHHNGSLTEALLVKTDVEMAINGVVATVTYQQEFHNTSEDWVEGRYVFPLPETAAVNAMTLHLGERVIVGEIKEKQEAQRVYQQAKEAGQRASLVEQQRPNLFSQKVANIGPGERIQVTLSYRQTVEYEHGRFGVRLPLTITPRYIPGSAGGEDPASDNPAVAFNDQGWSVPTDQVPDAQLLTPFMTAEQTLANDSLRNPVSIAVQLNAGLPLARIDSPYHDIVIHKQGKQHSIRLSASRVPMDRDFVLNWQAASQQAPRAALFTEHVVRPNPGAEDPGAEDPVTGEDFLLLMLLPPQASSQTDVAATLPREVTFIIDTSGSMAGTSIQQAKASLQLALSTLTERDRFNIVEFNSHFQRYSPQAQPATAHNLRSAQAFVSRLNATGGTEMYAPLDAVLSESAPEGFLKQVIFITDGSVGNESALFQLIENKLASARLFMVGIGSAPNSYFMRKSAQFGRGTFTHVGDLNEVADKMSELFRQLQAPLLRDIHIDWPDGIVVDSFPRRQPDLYAGQPLLLKARVLTTAATGLQAGAVILSGQTAQGPWSQTLPLVLAKTAGHNGIASLWARDKIAALMDQQHTGTAEADIKPQVLEVALTHQLLSAYTSFVAVDQTPARPVEAPLDAQATPNLVAHGQVPQPQTLTATQAFSYPQTALGLNGQIGLASALLLTALIAFGLTSGTGSRRGADRPAQEE